MYILDGAFGTLIMQRNVLAPGEDTLIANEKAPETVTAIHGEYISAGSEVICANTFSASRAILDGIRSGTPDAADSMIASGISSARSAITVPTVKLALDVAPTGDFFEPHGDLTEDETARVYAKLAEFAAQCDFAALETFYDTRELSAALNAFTATRTPALACMTFDENGRTFAGATAEDFASVTEKFGFLTATGINCSLPPKQMTKTAISFARLTRLPIILKLNAGLPSSGILSPKRYAEDLYALTAEILDLGKPIFGVGGCCGTTPAHIFAVKELFTTKGIIG
jgi:5-methyltetrahydrofolate--homocysteine methyltransferase